MTTNENTAKSSPDVRQIMAEIRERVKQEIEDNKTNPIPFKGAAVDPNSGSRKAGELVYSEDLRYLNHHYVVPTQPNLEHITSHRGFLGKIIVKVKRKILVFIWNLLGAHFQAEQEFRSHLIKHLNDTSKYVDARDADNFWQLIKKIDVDTTKALERIERIADDHSATLRTTEKSINSNLSASIKELQEQLTTLKAVTEKNTVDLKTVDSVCRGMESILARLNTGQSNSQSSSAWKGTDQELTSTDYSYLLLENRFRGSEKEIKERQNIYPPYFKKAKKPVLELGPGRGELLELFKEEDIDAYGVDLDQAMVDVCQEKGLKVNLGNALSHLSRIDDHSIGGVIGIQIVEHLQREELEAVAKMSCMKVEKGGYVIFETINPQSLSALSSNYFRDPTHIWPQHPDTLRYVLEFAGITVEDVRYMSPVEGVLKEVVADEHMPPRWLATVDLINHNIKQLNSLLYGYMDYAIIGRVS